MPSGLCNALAIFLKMHDEYFFWLYWKNN
jgi:hypothetical protein